MLSCEYCKFFKNNCFVEHLRTAASESKNVFITRKKEDDLSYQSDTPKAKIRKLSPNNDWGSKKENTNTCYCKKGY